MTTQTAARSKRKPAGLAKVTVEQEFIDPKQAVQILQKKNPRNRKVDRGNINKLAAQMEANQWLPGVAIIQFDSKGNLADGQHTLYAIEKSNLGQWVTVIRGVPSQALNVINTGKRLTLADHPDIKDLPNRGVISALVYFIYKYDSGLRGQQMFGDLKNYSASTSGSFTDLLRTFEDNKEEIIKYAALGAKVSRSIPVTASTMAQAAWLFHKIDEKDATVFFEKLETGLGLTKDSPIYALRERLITDMSNKIKGNRFSNWVILGFTIKAWNFYRRGESIQRLRYSYGGSMPESYPEPI